jgi:hypothetical protein
MTATHAPQDILTIETRGVDGKMANASRRGIGKIAAAAIVVVMAAMVVGVGGFFGSQGPPERLSAQAIVSLQMASSSISQSYSVSSTTQSTCTNGEAVNGPAGSSAPPCGCALVDSNSNGSLYVSPDPKVGDSVCVEASLNDSARVTLSITNSAGGLVFSDTCVATQSPGALSPTGDSCATFWNTGNPDPQGNAIGPGSYHLVASGSSAAVQLEANFTLS